MPNTSVLNAKVISGIVFFELPLLLPEPLLLELKSDTIYLFTKNQWNTFKNDATCLFTKINETLQKSVCLRFFKFLTNTNDINDLKDINDVKAPRGIICGKVFDLNSHWSKLNQKFAWCGIRIKPTKNLAIGYFLFEIY